MDLEARRLSRRGGGARYCVFAPVVRMGRSSAGDRGDGRAATVMKRSVPTL
jgi:hypothetical protein